MIQRALALFAALFFAAAAFAADGLFEGHDYVTVKPRGLAPEAGRQVVVEEFFWYRCPHCFRLEPGLKRWSATLPKDVTLRRIPAVFRPDWQPGARLYYALEQMNLVDRLHQRVFDAYHVQQINLDDPAVLFDWMARQGVDRAKFKVAYEFGATARVNAGQRRVTAYGISGVPAFVVDGKYLTSVSITGSEERLFQVLDQLIVKARAERAAKPR